MVKLPDFLTPVIDAFHRQGAVCVVVGGFVRDSILGIDSKDIDIEIFNIDSYETMSEILKPFGSANLVGKSFGVLKMSLNSYEIDFSLPRLEKKVSRGHRGFEITLDPSLAFQEAAKRRDFTINAIGYNIQTKTILDPYNGVKDLKNKTLSYVNEQTFIEDPLRIFRALQFCARFRLQCSDELIKSCCYISDNHLVKELPKERIYEEFTKLLTLAKEPSIGLKLLKTFHLMQYFPELLDLNNDFIYLDKMTKLLTDDPKLNLILMLSVLVFDIKTKERVRSFLERFVDEKLIVTEVLNFYAHKDSLAKLSAKKPTDYEITLLSTQVSIQYLLLINEARGVKYEKIKSRASNLHVLRSKPKSLLRGKDLIKAGLQPSPLFSSILNRAYDAQLQGSFTTYEDARKWLQNVCKTL